MQPALRVRTLITSLPVPCFAVRSAERLLNQSAIRRKDDKSLSDYANPFNGYVADLLDAPLRAVKPATKTTPSLPPAESNPKTEEEERVNKARVVFGWQDGSAGPSERRREKEAKSQNVAGVMVPVKPDEPDNCCMSGCMNCVWDMYRDELEEWAELSTKARVKVAEQKREERSIGSIRVGSNAPAHVAMSMDDDGGGSETNWAGGSEGSEVDLFANVPVGIREFMKIEKRLKEKLKREQGLP
ncbi:hypothetical protein LTR08_001402 [Meristemomyces frigidus]|nr:hypothetical protein LTR08_001402 [Meristemomyces frigidus]